MRPTATEVLQGIQGALATYVQPEVQSDYAQTELMLIQMLLGVVVQGYDDAAQNLVDDNAAMRSLAGDTAQVLQATPLAGAKALAEELGQLSKETDASVRVSELTAANGKLRDAMGRLGVLLQDSAIKEHASLRASIIERLHHELEMQPHNMMGPRADG